MEADVDEWSECGSDINVVACVLEWSKEAPMAEILQQL